MLSPSTSGDPPPLPPPTFTCACGKCTLSSWLKKGCPNSSADSRFPYLDHERLTTREQRALEIKLQSECNDIIFLFSGLVGKTINSMAKRKIPVSELARFIHDLGAFVSVHPQKSVLYDRMDGIDHAANVDEVFRILLDYRSFFNYGIIEHLIRHLGTSEDAQNLEDYKAALGVYLQRRIFECPPDVYKPYGGDYKTDLIVKIGEKEEIYLKTVQHVREFQAMVAKILGLEPEALLLCTINKGCLQLEFQVPNFIVEIVFPLSPDQINTFKAKGILHLKCGTLWKYDLEQEGNENSEQKYGPQAMVSSYVDMIFDMADVETHRVCNKCLVRDNRSPWALMASKCFDPSDHRNAQMVEVRFNPRSRKLEPVQTLPSRIRPVPDVPFNRFILCDRRRSCKGENCTFPHSKEEMDAWNAHRSRSRSQMQRK